MPSDTQAKVARLGALLRKWLGHRHSLFQRLSDCNKFLSDYASILYFAFDSYRPRNFKRRLGPEASLASKRSQPMGSHMKPAAAPFRIAGDKTLRARTSHQACSIARSLHAALADRGHRSPSHPSQILLGTVFPELGPVHEVISSGAISSIPTSCRIPVVTESAGTTDLRWA